MIAPSKTHPKWHQSLQVRAVVLLSLALLPIGLIALLQTKSIADDTTEASQEAVLALTERAAISERLIIEQASGAAKLLASMVPVLSGDTDLCETYLSNFTDRNPRFSFAGIVPLSGLMTCSSTGNTFDFSTMDGFQASMDARRASVTMNRNGVQSGQSVIIIAEPYLLDGEFGGYASISVPHNKLLPDEAKFGPRGLRDIVTFNANGDVLTSQNDLDQAVAKLPSSIKLSDLSNHPDTPFIDTNQRGEDRVYAFVPIRDGALYVLGIWDPSIGNGAGKNSWILPSLFPVLMWIASLVVAYLAVHRLVTRHVHHLRTQMTRFASSRHFQPTPSNRNMPTELVEIDDAFNNMASSILRDEATLENALSEKNRLIKEIHHRVKNNLQLISSIINMQARATKDDQTKHSLRSVQERVINMATIHHDILPDNKFAQVNTKTLVSDLIRKNRTVSSAIDADTLSLKIEASDDIRLSGDQAVPFSLLVAELATKAVKSIGPDGGVIEVSFDTEDSGIYILRLSATHSKDHASMPADRLNEQLIKAFVIQLDATITSKRDGETDVTTLTFRPSDRPQETLDY